MDSWIAFALLSPVIYALVNFLDKYILQKEITDYTILPFYASMVSFIAGMIFFVATGFPLLPFKDGLLVIITGILTIWSLVLYFKVLSREATSIIIFLFQLIPVFVLILSIILLKETIQVKQYFGFALIFIATLIVTLKRHSGKSSLSTFAFMCVFNLISATTVILIKFAINVTSFSSILSYESWGIGVGGIILYLTFSPYRKRFHESLCIVRKKTLGVLLINETMYVVAKSFGFLAYSLGPVALVSVIGTSQVFFGFLYGALLTMFFPTIFKEDVSRKGLMKKVAAAILLFVGIWIIS